MSQQEDDPFGNYSDETEVGVGFSDTALLAVSVAGFAVMALLIYSIILSRVQPSDELEKEGGGDGALDYEEKLLQSDISSLNRAQRRARAKALMKRQRRVDDPQQHQQLQEEADDNNDAHAAEPHLSRKERQKAAKAAEKKERHLLDEKREQEQRKAMQLAQEEKKKRLELEAEKAQEEKRRREQEEEQRRLQEYQAWNTFLASPDGSVSLTVEEWTQELQKHNVIPLDDLTRRFDVPVDTIKNRINELVRAGRVTGVLDEAQNAFIVLSHEQLLSLAAFIKSKGEVSLDELSGAAGNLLANKDIS